MPQSEKRELSAYLTTKPLQGLNNSTYTVPPPGPGIPENLPRSPTPRQEITTQPAVPTICCSGGRRPLRAMQAEWATVEAIQNCLIYTSEKISKCHQATWDRETMQVTQDLVSEADLMETIHRYFRRHSTNHMHPRILYLDSDENHIFINRHVL